MGTRLRITLGTLRGQWIRTRPNLAYRPMPARLREAFFHHAGPRIADCRFMDGFAGTGIMGFYALSLGAAHVAWIERDPAVVRLLRENARRLGVLRRTTICRGDMERILLQGTSTAFDWIFWGPPYTFPTERLNRLMAICAAHGWVRMGTCLGIQRFKKAPQPHAPGWRAYHRITHGDNVIHLYAWEPGI